MTAVPDTTPGPPDAAGPGVPLALLAVLSVLGAFATNVFLPAFADIAAALGTEVAAVQMTLTIYLGTFAVTQLIYGPFADRFGRRPLLLGGLALYLIGGVAGAASQSIGELVVARIVQAAGAGAGLVTSRAVMRDLREGPSLARGMSILSMAGALVPGLVPLLGGLLTGIFGWRSTFLATALLGAACLFLVAVRLPETMRARAPRLDPAGLVTAYGAVWGTPAFRAWSLSASLVMGGLFAFFAGSPRLFLEELGVGPIEYGFYPPIAVSGFFVGSLLTARMAGRVPPERAGTIGLALLLAGTIVIGGPPLIGLLHAHQINAGMVVFVTGLGVFFPVAMAAALQPFARGAGTASALLGFLQMAVAALFTAAVGMVQTRAPVLGVPALMAVAVVAAWVAFVSGTRLRRTRGA